ncbi:MAG: tetratricopeptide repeat protein, partial [Spirulina sp.]
SLSDRVRFCWHHWPIEGNVLIIFDDVTEYQEIEPFLPPDDSRFKVIITTRSQKLHQAFEGLNLKVLSEKAALEMLQSFLGESRIEAELEAAKSLCEWLGYLPLGLELVGQYLQDKDLSLVEMRRRLERRRLAQTALKKHTIEATAQRGVREAFELSWQELPEDAKEVAGLLSLFAVAPIPWGLVQECFDWDEEDLEDIRDGVLVKLSLLQRLEGSLYQLHPLLQKFMRDKLEASETAEIWKRKYCGVMVRIARQIPHTPTLEQIENFAVFIPHLEAVAENLCDAIEDEESILPFLGIACYYNGQGLYSQAEPWYEQCLSVAHDRLGEDHISVAISLNNLALLYSSQGRYEEAKLLYFQALALSRKLLGEDHLSVAISLNNLAEIYYVQGRYEEAEPLFSQALSLSRKLLGEDHPNIATSLNNLALVYSSQGRYEEAEPLFSQALALRRKLLGEDYPDVANSLNNLALLYYAQERYEEAEPLFSQALALRRKLLGEDYPNVANSLNNLALVYSSQGRYEEAEPLFSQALTLSLKLLGEDHPHVANSLNNLALLYSSQGRYEEAESLSLQALALRRKLLGEDHPDVATSLNNLAFLYSSQGRYEEAEYLYSQAIFIVVNRLGFEHPNSQTMLQNFWDCLQKAIAAGKRDQLSNHPLTQDILKQIDIANKEE